MSEIRRAFHSILRKPAYALAALFTIALGIGANTAVYTVVRSVLLEPLPFREPKALVQVWETHPELHNLQVSVPDYLDWKKSVTSVDFAAYTFQAMNKATLLGQGDPLDVQATNASSELFPLLGIEPILGHAYGAQQENAKEPVVLISEQLWRRKFSSDPTIVGHPLRLDATSFTILGVVPQTQAFPVWADVWVPFSFVESELQSTRKYHPLEVIGRLKPGVSLRQAELETETVAQGLSATFSSTNGRIGALVMPLMEAVTGEVRPALVTVWIAVGLVLLIGCANLALLMMARSLDRRRDVAVRLALGASKRAAVREFFLETLMLSVAGGVLGMFAAAATLPVLRNMAQGRIPRLDTVALDASALMFGLLISCLVALLFAVPACWQVSYADLNQTLASADARVSSTGGSWISSLLMTFEVALSLAVLLAATMLVRSFALTLDTDPGFRPERVLAVNVPLAQEWDKSYDMFLNRILPGLQSIPGVQEVAGVNSLPMTLASTEHTRYATRFGVEGTTTAPGQFPTAQIRWCTANYFHVLGIPLESGRLLKEADRNTPRYLVNEAFAEHFFPDQNAVGQKLLLGVVTPNPEEVEVVGVVGNIRDFGLDTEPPPTIYSVDVSPRMDVVIKTSRNSTSLVPSIAAAIRQVAPQNAIGQVRTLRDYIDSSLARQRFILSLIAIFAGLAMVLCAVGIYGVFSYSVSRRLREFGIRSALGAQKRDLLALLFRECLVVVVPGLVAGMLISLGSSHFLRALLYRVSPTDAFSYAIAVLSIFFLCSSSALLPAKGASGVDLVRLLREP
jgi:predicted permease